MALDFLAKIGNTTRSLKAIIASVGVVDANKIVATGSQGIIDRSLLPKTKQTWCWSVAINQGNTSGGTLRRQNGTGTNNCPFIIPVDCLLQTVATSSNPIGRDSSWSFQIFRNGTLYYSTTNNVGSHFTVVENINLPFSKDDSVSMFYSRIGSANISHPGGSLYFIEI